MNPKDPLKDEYAVLSKASYDYYHHGLDTAQKELRTYTQTKGYSIDPALSNKNAVVLKNGNKVVISYRGTDLKNPSDLLADAEILLGRDKVKLFLNDRFDSANQLYEKVKKEYPESEITLTGHSLGSAEAIYVGTKNNTRSVSFNEGTSPMDALLSHFGSPEADKKQTVYITGKDVVSNLSILEPYDIRFVSAKNDLNFLSHSLNYFLPEKSSSVPEYLNTVYHPSYKPKKGISRQSYADLTNQYGIDYFKELAKKRAAVY
jgi:hypothetical protein